jgi:hypothetical protein
MKQMIRELKRQVAGEKLEPEQLKGLIRAGLRRRSKPFISLDFSVKSVQYSIGPTEEFRPQFIAASRISYDVVSTSVPILFHSNPRVKALLWES